MYQVQYQPVADAIESDSRCFRALLDFGEFQIKDNDVGMIKPSMGSVQNDTPCIGSVVSTQCEIEIMNIPPEAKKLEGKEFQLYFYLIDPTAEFGNGPRIKAFYDFSLEELGDYTIEQLSIFSTLPYEPIPIAKLTVLKCKKLSDYYTLTCSDRLHFADSKYKSELTYPATSDEVMAEIAQQIGCEAESEPPQSYLVSNNGYRLLSSEGHRLITSSWQFAILENPTGYTKRQIIGFIAAMRGKFAVIDRTGTLVQRWYGEGVDISFTPGDEGRDRYIDDYEISETSIAFENLTCIVNQDQTLVVGDTKGRKMEFECPYMTNDRLGKLYEEVCHYAEDYYPCDFTQRLGDPRIDLWDRFYDDGKLILMLNMDYTFDGGLMLTVSSGGRTDTETF